MNYIKNNEIPTKISNRLSTGIQALTIALLNFMLVGQAFATTVTWDGSQNNNWRNNTNWTGGGTPGSADAGIFPIGESRNAVDLSGSGGNDRDRELDTLDLRTDGQETTTEPSVEVNWYFKRGRIEASDIYWKSTASNSEILVNATFLSSSDTIFRGDSSGASSLHLYGSGLSGLLSLSTFWLNSAGGDDSLVIYGATPFDGVFKVTSGTLVLKNLNALRNARVQLLGGELTLDTSVILGHLTGGLNAAPVNILGGNLLKFGLYAGDQTFAGIFTGTGHLFYNNLSSPGSLKLTGASTFSGRTTVNGTLILAAGGSLANSPVQINTTNTSLKVDGSTTVGNLWGNGKLILNQALTIRDVLNVNSETLFSGTISGTGSLTIAAGDHSFTDTGGTGPALYTGNVNLNGGSTTFGAGLFRESRVTVNADAAMTMNADTTLGSFAGTGDLDLLHNLTFGSLNQNNTYSGDLTGNGVLTKNGSGTWVFDGAKTGAGHVNISEGTLGGGGSIAATLYIAPGAGISPGSSTGTMTLGVAVIDGVYNCELDGVSNDRLVVASDFDISVTTLDLSEIGSGATAAVYIIASYGTLFGTFAAVQNLPAAYTIDYAYNDGSSSNNIALVRDVVAPSLDSIDLDPALNDPSNASSVAFDISFSEPVTGVDAGDFNITFLGSKGTATLTGSGVAYSLTIPNISGDGLLAISLGAGHGIIDTAGNPLASMSPSGSVVIDQTPPVVDSFTAITNSPTNATEIEFSVSFSETVLDFDAAADVSADETGTVAYTGVVISGSGTNYTIQYTGVSGDGELTAVINAIAGGARDEAGNLLPADVTGPMIVVAPVHCNNSLASGTVNGDAKFEACEHLFTEADFYATEFATVIFAAGEGITLNPGFTLDVGAIMQVKVCGQSLCQVSSQPMEYGCHSCVTDICDIDSSCCGDEYSQACVDKVSTVCNLSCQ